MYLKSLVLKGFKSFADRSSLVLEPGITAIVGPNGSGKSNISDAVLWVLGERNAKHLRGQAMQDVIFAGSSARRATGLAEVDLVLDNTDATLPVDFSEVSITRRMYRSGESEYLINGSPARRMDVLDILHDSGLGSATHSIISQGSLESILQSSPEERRALIEEAAGVLKHKQRKAKSERKLERMDAHLARARDVAAEVERQLRPLERKAKKARSYQETAAELSKLTLKLAVDDLRQLRSAHADVTAREGAAEAQCQACRVRITEAEQAVEQLQARLTHEGRTTEELQHTQQAISRAMERIDSTALLMRERRRHASTNAAELKVSLEENNTRVVAIENELSTLNEQLSNVKMLHKSADEKVGALETSFLDLSSRHSETEARAHELSCMRTDLESRINAARSKHTELKEALSNGLAQIKIIEGHTQELLVQYKHAEEEARLCAEALQAHTNALKESETQLEQARLQLAHATQAREEAHKACDEAQDVVRDLHAQIAAIEQLERESERQSGSAREWVSAHGRSLDETLGALTHEIKVSEPYEALVERILAADVESLLVTDDDALCAFKKALVAQDLAGALTLLLRNDASAVRLPNAAAFDSIPGVALMSQLSCKPSAKRAVQALLGDVVVCESLEEALVAHAQDTHGLRFVGKDGSIVWPSGKVSLGRKDSLNAEGALARARRADELRTHYALAQQAFEAAQTAASAADEELRTAQSESLNATQAQANASGQLEAARLKAKSADDTLESLSRELEEVERKRTQAQALISEAQPDVEEYRRLADELGVELEGVKESLARALDAVAPLRDEAKSASDALAAARLEAATLVERETYTQRVYNARAQECDQLRSHKTTLRRTLFSKELSAKRIEPLLDLFSRLSLSAQDYLRDIETQSADVRSSQSGLFEQARQARERARAAHDEYDAASEQLSNARVEKGRLEVQVEAAVHVIVSDCATPLETALLEPELENRSEIEDTAFRLRRRIANMGTINPDAADEYEALKLRFEYLSSQLSDLDTARRSLAKINRVIDARMKDDFINTYEAVDTNFQEIFATLFPGGTAHLSLEDPQDLENSGVEVSAQPRGKRITKMTLMSGGEKSLTALALLFAVYRVRATPFYILDEVEAALDDTNLRRLITYLDGLRATTQLIMITHQRRTMEAADVLFGVSMQSDGVTKVISQKLDRALQYAE